MGISELGEQPDILQFYSSLRISF